MLATFIKHCICIFILNTFSTWAGYVTSTNLTGSHLQARDPSLLHTRIPQGISGGNPEDHDITLVPRGTILKRDPRSLHGLLKRSPADSSDEEWVPASKISYGRHPHTDSDAESPRRQRATHRAVSTSASDHQHQLTTPFQTLALSPSQQTISRLVPPNPPRSSTRSRSRSETPSSLLPQRGSGSTSSGGLDSAYKPSSYMRYPSSGSDDDRGTYRSQGGSGPGSRRSSLQRARKKPSRVSDERSRQKEIAGQNEHAWRFRTPPARHDTPTPTISPKMTMRPGRLSGEFDDRAGEMGKGKGGPIRNRGGGRGGGGRKGGRS